MCEKFDYDTKYGWERYLKYMEEKNDHIINYLHKRHKNVNIYPNSVHVFHDIISKIFEIHGCICELSPDSDKKIWKQGQKIRRNIELSIVPFGYNRVYNELKKQNALELLNLIKEIRENLPARYIQEVPSLHFKEIVGTSSIRIKIDMDQYSILRQTSELLGISTSDLILICCVYTFNVCLNDSDMSDNMRTVFFEDKGYISQIRKNIKKFSDDVIKFFSQKNIKEMVNNKKIYDLMDSINVPNYDNLSVVTNDNIGPMIDNYLIIVKNKYRHEYPGIKYLVGLGYMPEYIYVNRCKGIGDITTMDDRKNWEVKILAQNGILFTIDQMRYMSNDTSILIFKKGEDTLLHIVEFEKIKSGQDRTYNFYVGSTTDIPTTADIINYLKNRK